MEQVLGQAGAGLAVAAGVLGAVGQPLGGAVGGEAIDGLLAGVVGVEALVQEGPDGGGGGVDAVAVSPALVVEGVEDLLLGEVSGDGQAGRGDEVTAGVGDLTGERSWRQDES